jgi:hypothetical protein
MNCVERTQSNAVTRRRRRVMRGVMQLDLVRSQPSLGDAGEGDCNGGWHLGTVRKRSKLSDE